MQLLFLVAVGWALYQAFIHDRTQVRSARSAARRRAPDHARRAARQATIAWWLREARHLFPETRHGLGNGWADHRHATVQHERDRAQRDADHAEEQAGWRQQIADHRRRMEEAARKYRERQPEPEPAAPDDDPPLADGKTQGQGKPRQPEPDPPKPPPSSNGHKTTGGEPVTTPSGADAGYEQVLAAAEEVQTMADSVDVSALEKIGPLIDQLGALLPDDAQTVSVGADLHRACMEVKTNLDRVKDLAAALHTRVKDTYGPTHEATQSAGHVAEREFHTTG